MGWQPPLPNSSRLIDWGHSWVAPPPYPYASANIADTSILAGQGQYPHNGEQWPWALRDALGIGAGGQYYKTYVVPAVATASSVTTFLDYMIEDGTIEAIYYIPNGTLTGANSNTRKVQLSYDTWLGFGVVSGVQFNSGTNGAQGVPIRIYSINDNTGIQSNPGVFATNGPYVSALRGTGNNTSTILSPRGLYWVSTAVGSGLADPGGTVLIRYGTRYRNYGVAGSTLLQMFFGFGTGNWLTCMSLSPWSRPNGVEVNLTAACSTSTIACQALEYPLLAGAIINFPGGISVTTSANANFRATSISLTGAPSSTVPINSQGHALYQPGAASGYGETLSPTGINVWTHGVNDADAGVQDVNAWAECVRAVIARTICPVWDYAWQSNFAYTGGGGAWNPLQVSASTPPTSGVPLAISDSSYNGLPLEIWTGTVSGSPSFTMSLGPAFEGGNLDVMFLAIAGSSLGVAGTLTVDGSPPPSQNPCTINTSGMSTSGISVRTSTATQLTASASNTVTVTGGTGDFSTTDIGKVLVASVASGTLPAGSIITAVASASSITVIPPGGAALTFVTTGTVTVNGWYPMVKRITGLAQGAHTVTFTITGSDSTAQSAIVVYGIGIESNFPPTPAIWCNIARCPFQTSGQKTNAVALNTASSQVIAGSYTPLSGNSQEPKFPPNVQYVDLDSLFSASSSYFIDGLHFNSRGHRLMARTIFNVLQARYSPDELISR